MKRFAQKGYSVVELAIAVLIMGVMVGTIMGARTFIAKQTQNNSDKAYATEKAIQMFEELKSLVGNNTTQDFQVLDGYTNSSYDTVLTTDVNVDKPTTGVANPVDPLSGNRAYGSSYRYARKVLVQKTSDPYTRVIYVWVYGLMGNSAATTNTNAFPILAQVTGVVRISTSPQLPAQVMDVYLLAIQNVQGWWSQVPSLENTFTNIISDLQVVNNGTFYIRPHYITRLSYGRDPYYTPYINSAADTSSATIPWVYLYPGSVRDNNNAVENFYDPEVNGVLQTGDFNIDGTVNYPYYPTLSGGSQALTYSVADQYNTSVRYPDELAAYAAVTAQAATLCGQTSEGLTEISERMLLEQMNSSPQSFTNAIIVNLHGEMLPMPPMHNYSDAAKDPGNVIYGNSSVSLNGMAVSAAAKDARVVTHPELLYYPTTVASGNVTMRLRVYAYYDGLDSCAVTGTGAVTNVKTGDPELPGISVLLKNLYIPATSAGTSLAITAVSGGVSLAYQDIAVTNASGTGNFFSSRAGDPVSAAVTNVTSGGVSSTLITLYNTRLRCPNASGVTSNTGLFPANELYGLEYIPCSADVTGPVTSLSNPITFTNQDLSYAVTGVPKNTARWIIQLNSVPVTIGAAGGGPLTIETRIGAGVTTSVAGASLSALPLSAGSTIPGVSPTVTLLDVPTNLSRTYAWLGVTPPPYTERYQYMGDPRDCPYLDVKVGGPQVSGLVTIGPCSYNWWFKDVTNGTTGVDGYLGFMNTQMGWGNTSDPVLLNQDVPRYFQTLRNGLLNTTSIWSSVNGWTGYYMGFGGEIGYNQNPFPQGVSYNLTPWSTSSTATVHGIDEILTEPWLTFLTNVCIPANVAKSGAPSTDMWYAKPWLGELYPDSQFASFWYKNGNLPTAAMAAATFTAATNPVTFYREDMANIPITVSTYTTTSGFGGKELGKSVGPYGIESFTEGYSNWTSAVTGSGVLEHDGGPNGSQNASINNLATTCFGIFGIPLSGSVSCTRPWNLTSTGTALPSEWGIPVTNNGYNNGYTTNNPVTVSIPSVSGVSRIFYTSDDTNIGSPAYGSGVVQMASTGGKKAFMIESGLATSSQFGPEQLGKTSMIFMLRTFLDGGLMAGVSQVGHIVQLPLVQASTPESPTGQYSNPQTIHVVISGAVTNSTNPWYRFEGLSSSSANFYTQEYPGYTTSAPLTASTYSEASTQAFLLNFKYSVVNSGSSTNPVTWYFMSSGTTISSQAQTGVLNNSQAVTTTTFPVTFSWNVSDPNAFPQNNYTVLCEAYRQGFPLHYSFHSITLTVDR
jgi:hypothetical protein